MKKIIISAIVFIIVSISAFSQVVDPIVAGKKGLRTQYMQNDRILKRKEIALVLNSYSPSAKEFKMASVYSTIGALFISSGGLVIGASSLASSLKDLNAINTGSGEFSDLNNNTPYYIGISLAVVGIPLILIGNSHFIKSIVLYNSQNNAGSIGEINLSAGITSAGVGVKLQF